MFYGLTGGVTSYLRLKIKDVKLKMWVQVVKVGFISLFYIIMRKKGLQNLSMLYISVEK